MQGIAGIFGQLAQGQLGWPMGSNNAQQNNSLLQLSGFPVGSAEATQQVQTVSKPYPQVPGANAQLQGSHLDMLLSQAAASGMIQSSLTEQLLHAVGNDPMSLQGLMASQGASLQQPLNSHTGLNQMGNTSPLPEGQQQLPNMALQQQQQQQQGIPQGQQMGLQPGSMQQLLLQGNPQLLQQQQVQQQQLQQQGQGQGNGNSTQMPRPIMPSTTPSMQQQQQAQMQQQQQQLASTSISQLLGQLPNGANPCAANVPYGLGGLNFPGAGAGANSPAMNDLWRHMSSAYAMVAAGVPMLPPGGDLPPHLLSSFPMLNTMAHQIQRPVASVSTPGGGSMPGSAATPSQMPLPPVPQLPNMPQFPQALNLLGLPPNTLSPALAMHMAAAAGGTSLPELPPGLSMLPGMPPGMSMQQLLGVGGAAVHASMAASAPLAMSPLPPPMSLQGMGPGDMEEDADSKRMKRKLSNRESARRSRLRKQAEHELTSYTAEGLTCQNSLLKKQFEESNAYEAALDLHNAHMQNCLELLKAGHSLSDDVMVAMMRAGEAVSAAQVALSDAETAMREAEGVGLIGGEAKVSTLASGTGKGNTSIDTPINTADLIGRQKVAAAAAAQAHARALALTRQPGRGCSDTGRGGPYPGGNQTLPIMEDSGGVNEDAAVGADADDDEDASTNNDNSDGDNGMGTCNGEYGVVGDEGINSMGGEGITQQQQHQEIPSSYDAAAAAAVAAVAAAAAAPGYRPGALEAAGAAAGGEGMQMDAAGQLRQQQMMMMMQMMMGGSELGASAAACAELAASLGAGAELAVSAAPAPADSASMSDAASSSSGSQSRSSDFDTNAEESPDGNDGSVTSAQPEEGGAAEVQQEGVVKEELGAAEAVGVIGGGSGQ